MDNPIIIKELHASEIHGSVSWFYDSCWTAGLGSDVGGWERREDVRQPRGSRRVAAGRGDPTLSGQRVRQEVWERLHLTSGPISILRVIGGMR
jgi:hypothetical protein